MNDLPTSQQAEQMLCEAAAQNPGPWVEHSRYCALAARQIAANHPQMDAETAYTLGLLHDLGRYRGVFDLLHIVHGYDLLMERGYPFAAQISLTHSFPTQIAEHGKINWDGTDDQFAWLDDYLSQVEYTAYDRLIQLCDALALPQGFCLIEKRMVDVAMRRGIDQYTLIKWHKLYELKAEFETAIGTSIYAVLPGVVETTFSNNHTA